MVYVCVAFFFFFFSVVQGKSKSSFSVMEQSVCGAVGGYKKPPNTRSQFALRSCNFPLGKFDVDALRYGW